MYVGSKICKFFNVCCKCNQNCTKYIYIYMCIYINAAYANVTVIITDAGIHPSHHPPPTHLYVLLIMMDERPLDKPYVISKIMFAC